MFVIRNIYVKYQSKSPLLLFMISSGDRDDTVTSVSYRADSFLH